MFCQILVPWELNRCFMRKNKRGRWFFNPIHLGNTEINLKKLLRYKTLKGLIMPLCFRTLQERKGVCSSSHTYVSTESFPKEHSKV